MIFALAAAVGWGLADFLGAVSTRRVGLLVTMCVGLIVGCTVLGITAATPAVDGVHLAWGDVGALVVSGILGAGSYAGFYRALQLGPVSLVSPIFSAYAMVAVVMAVLVGGQALGAAATAGVALTIGGVALASASGQPTAPGSSLPPAGRRHSGVPYALAAMLAWGVTTYILARSAEHLGWFVPVAVSRVVTLVVLLAAAAAIALGSRGGQPSPVQPSPVQPPPVQPPPVQPPPVQPPPVRAGAPLTRLALPAVAGLLDMLAFLAFARAGQVGPVAVAATASACFPLIVIAGGVLVFKERLRPVQFAGAGLTIAGLLVLGLSQ
jgi:drug/metabolite transporter (DMT)-like permease